MSPGILALAGEKPDRFRQHREQHRRAHDSRRAPRDEQRFPPEHRDQPIRKRPAHGRAQRVSHHDHRHDGGAIALRRVFDVERPGQRQHSAERKSVDEAQREQRPVAACEVKAHREDAEGRGREDHRRPPPHPVRDVGEDKPAQQRAHLMHGENIAGLRRGQVIILAKVGCREADQVGVEAVEKRDDPGDRDQPDQEAAQLLIFDDLGNVDHAHARFSCLSFFVTSTRPRSPSTFTQSPVSITVSGS